jgi:hypothetical protein
MLIAAALRSSIPRILAASRLAPLISSCAPRTQSLILGKWQAENAMKMTAEFSSDSAARLTTFGQTIQGSVPARRHRRTRVDPERQNYASQSRCVGQRTRADQSRPANNRLPERMKRTNSMQDRSSWRFTATAFLLARASDNRRALSPTPPWVSILTPATAATAPHESSPATPKSSIPPPFTCCLSTETQTEARTTGTAMQNYFLGQNLWR